MNIEDFRIVEERLRNMSEGLHPTDDDIELLIEFYDQPPIKVFYSSIHTEAEYLISSSANEEIIIDIFKIKDITPYFYHYPTRKNIL